MRNNKDKVKYTKELFEKVKSGDEEATTLLFESVKDIIYTRAMNVLNNHYDAEEIVTEAFLRAVKKLDTLKKPSDFPSWIGRIAENKAKDFLKKNRTVCIDESNFDFLDDNVDNKDSVDPQTIAETKENIDLYQKLIQTLSDEQRTAINNK